MLAGAGAPSTAWVWMVLARSTLNFPEWATYLLGQLDRLKLLTASPDVTALADEVSRYPNVTALRTHPPPRHWPEEPALLVPWNVELNGTELSLFTTLTSFGTPRDITVAELAVELFYPAEDKTADVLRGWQEQPAPGRHRV